jgi:hypothetical protein
LETIQTDDYGNPFPENPLAQIIPTNIPPDVLPPTLRTSESGIINLQPSFISLPEETIISRVECAISRNDGDGGVADIFVSQTSCSSGVEVDGLK